MPFEIIPTLVIGFGSAGARVVRGAEAEIREHHPDLLPRTAGGGNYGLYHFLYPPPAPRAGGDSQAESQALLDAVAGLLPRLQGSQLPVAEQRYSVSGRWAKATFFTRVLLVADLHADDADAYCSSFLPALLNHLGGITPPTFHVVQCLAVGDFDEEPKDPRQLAGRLKQVHAAIEAQTQRFATRCYLVDRRTPGGVTLPARSDLEDLISLFLQSVLLADASGHAGGAVQSSCLWAAQMSEPPFGALGVTALDFPLADFNAYCEAQCRAALLDDLLAEAPEQTSSGIAAAAKSWARQALAIRADADKNAPPAPELAALPTGPMEETEDLLIRVEKHIDTGFRARLDAWIAKRREQTMRFMADAQKSLGRKCQEILNEFDAELGKALEHPKAPLKLAATFLVEASRELAAAQPAEEEELALIAPAAMGSEMSVIRKTLVDEIYRRPCFRAAMLYVALAIAVGVTLNSFWIFSLSLGQIITVVGVLALTGAVFLILMGWNAVHGMSEAFASAQVNARALCQRLDAPCRDGMRSLGELHRWRLVHSLRRFVRGLSGHFDLLLRYLKIKRTDDNKVIDELDDIGRKIAANPLLPEQDRRVRDSRFRFFMVKEDNFRPLWEAYARDTGLIENLRRDFRPDVTLDAGELYRVLCDHVRKAMNAIRSEDFLLDGQARNAPAIANFKAALCREARNVPVYYRFTTDTQSAERGAQLLLFLAHPDQQRILDNAGVTPPPDVRMNLARLNRACFIKIQYGMSLASLGLD